MILRVSIRPEAQRDIEEAASLLNFRQVKKVARQVIFKI